jgi:hypothetical protein
MFCKIVQLSSHMTLSVNVAIFNPCISLGGALCINLENKTLLCLIVEKPRVGFGGLMTNN